MNKALAHVLQELDSLPEQEQARIAQLLEKEVSRARQPARGRRWAEVGDRLASSDLLQGESEALARTVRQWRESIRFDNEPSVPTE